MQEQEIKDHDFFLWGLASLTHLLTHIKLTNFINFRLSLPRPTVWSSFHPILILFWKKVLRIKIIFYLYFAIDKKTL